MRAALPGLLALALAAEQDPAPPDEERAAWAFKRSVALPAPTGEAAGFAALALPPELLARSRTDLRDLRLVGTGGDELPYVVQARGSASVRRAGKGCWRTSGARRSGAASTRWTWASPGGSTASC